VTEKIDCRIVEDLMANYIDGLTNQYTTECVNNHLEECNRCKKQYNLMKDNIALPHENIKKNIENSRQLNSFLIKVKRKNAIIVAILSHSYCFGYMDSRIKVL